MTKVKKLKVAIIRPPILGHMLRGTGVYADNLFRFLAKEKEASVQLLSIKDNLGEFDVVHYPYFDPFFLTLPFFKKKPTVVTVHDLIPLKFPNHFPAGLKGKIKWQVQKKSLAKASFVITDSLASKSDILCFTDVDQSKIKVVYLGVGKEYRQIGDDKLLQNTRKKLNLPDKFLLHVGDVNYNKNIVGLLKAFALTNKRQPDLYLVLVGKGFVRSCPQLTSLIDCATSLGVEDKVIRLGQVKLEDLVAVYNLALIYLQVSFAEGFGLPVLESMACGTPVVCSNISSLPEVAEGAALFVDPQDILQISKSIMNLLQDKARYKLLKEKGLKRSKEFTWEKTAGETINIYKKVVGQDLRKTG